jgi:hypothetical protein
MTAYTYNSGDDRLGPLEHLVSQPPDPHTHTQQATLRLPNAPSHEPSSKPAYCNVIYDRVNKTLGAMTGLVMDGIDVLGPVSGRIGMGYYDCYCESPRRTSRRMNRSQGSRC